MAPLGLAALIGAEEGPDVLDQRLFGKTRLADAGMDDAGALGAVLDLAALGRLNRPGDIRRDRTPPWDSA